MDVRTSLFFSEEEKIREQLAHLFFFKRPQIMNLDLLRLILEYFCADCIQPALLKNLDRYLTSVLVWVHL